ncbi:hypothetical protein CesoFtcFv8_012308 [Champsocephalus esox]|uniref:Ig-like domain-containing protein n=1 Tax=Champsocephalus esox TaxID=159716 RepID=A0AAN8GTV6_9TELE|nr:hypothetical protein CesoFtcFv8_012308 [Champsocephalus esox]
MNIFSSRSTSIQCKGRSQLDRRFGVEQQLRRASNPVSEVTSDPVTLLIVFGPENINLKISPSQEYYDEGSDIILTCSADSGPPAFIQWFLNET